jgi:hypothetical protein
MIGFRHLTDRMTTALADYEEACAEVDRREDAALKELRQRRAAHSEKVGGLETPESYAIPALLRLDHEYGLACSRRASKQRQVWTYGLAALVMWAAGAVDVVDGPASG